MASTIFELVTVSGDWDVPIDISSVFITAVAGGGGGGNGAPFSQVTQGAGGGGAGEFCRRYPLKVTPGGVITLAIGDGGSGGVSSIRGTDNTFGAGQTGNATTITNGITTIHLNPGRGGNPNNVIGNTVAGFGGGYGHGGVGNLNNTPGARGRPEGPIFCGGASGGGRTQTHVFVVAGLSYGARGGPCEGFLGGAGGPANSIAISSANGGSGGGASCFGPGGSGGVANIHGNPPPVTAYGAGGGGGGGFIFASGSQAPGAVGRGGAVLIEFIR